MLIVVYGAQGQFNSENWANWGGGCNIQKFLHNLNKMWFYAVECFTCPRRILIAACLY